MQDLLLPVVELQALTFGICKRCEYLVLGLFCLADFLVSYNLPQVLEFNLKVDKSVNFLVILAHNLGLAEEEGGLVHDSVLRADAAELLEVLIGLNYELALKMADEAAVASNFGLNGAFLDDETIRLSYGGDVVVAELVETQVRKA